MFPSCFVLYVKKKNATRSMNNNKQQQQQFSMPRNMKFRWIEHTTAPFAGLCVCIVTWLPYKNIRKHTNTAQILNEFAFARQSATNSVSPCARFKCYNLCSPNTWFSRKFITTVETTLMVSIILKKNWKDSREVVQVHTITLNYNHDYFKE